jgi:hypothetical protein
LEQTLQATNIFRKVNDKWYIVHHHSSWHADSEATKRALMLPPSPSKKKNQNRKKQSSSLGGPPPSLSLFPPSSNNNKDKKEDKTTPPMTEFDKIMGVSKFGPLLGDDKSGKDGDDKDKPVKRVIMGSLSDLLNGNLGGLLGDDEDDEFDDDDDDDVEDDDDEDDDDDDVSDGMIRFGSGEEDDEDDDDEEDEEDEDEGGDGYDGWSQSNSRRRSFRRKGSNKKTNHKRNNKSGLVVTPSAMSADLLKKEEDERRRQGCIMALRTLSSQGRISPKQKRTLLTDIISCSARGERSMVEVAYDLLYCGSDVLKSINKKKKLMEEVGDSGGTAVAESGGVGDEDNQDDIDNALEDAEDEFADQCIVLAQALDVGDNLYRR